MRVAVIDIGKPGKNLGWALSGPALSEGTDLDACVDAIANVLRVEPVALGFEAPMFVPVRNEPATLTKARHGEAMYGVSRPFSASAGATVLVTALVVVPYVLSSLRKLVPEATATIDWSIPLEHPGQLLLFEAFVTNQRKTVDTRHIEDARLAISAFTKGMKNPATFDSAILEDKCLSLLGAAMLRTGCASDPAIVADRCLVVRA